MLRRRNRFFFRVRICTAVRGEMGIVMSYQAIYRKWRPMVFEDIVGQGHITQTLKNQIVSGKIGHAYLFCGTRGTGKTTAAKIFARAVNCKNNTTGSPCNECEICRGILDGSILDVNEIDAASNNGVDNIREIRSDVNYTAVEGKYVVYIIDEVHMLSGGAFNALLKTLEEPPGHVIFILATTESHKVPQTILSRCQRFDFKRIKPSDIAHRMKEIAHAEGFSVTDDGFALLAKLADGSMRDGLSILERVTSSCEGTISGEDIINVLGISSLDLTFRTTQALIDRNTAEILDIIASVLADGKELNTFADNMLGYLRDLMVCKVAGASDELLDYSAEDMVKLKAQAGKITFEMLSHIIETLSKAKSEAKWLKDPRVVYELAFVKITHEELDDSREALLDRLSSVEEKVANGVAVVNVEAKPAPEKEKEPEKKEKVIPSERLFVPIPAEDRNSANPVVVAAKKWDKISRTILKNAPFLAIAINNRSITVDGAGIILLFEKGETMSYRSAVRYLGEIREMFKKASGVSCDVKAAWHDEVRDVEYDFWSFPKPLEGEVSNETMPEEQLQKDPLDSLAERFADIVEMSDDNAFVEYDEKESSFAQSSIDVEQEDDEEEFLDEEEIKQINNDEE